MEFVTETISEWFFKKKSEGVNFGISGKIASLHKIEPLTWFYKVSYCDYSP